MIEQFHPWQTRLRPASEYYTAQQAAKRYILELDADRLLYPYRREAGVEQPRRADGPVKPYPNWESTGLDGHIGGHYLSGLADFWVIDHDEAFRDRSLAMLEGLAECQEMRGTGFVGGMPNSSALFDELARGIVKVRQSFSLNGAWVPLYNLHKVFAGLIDTWMMYGDDGTDESRSSLVSATAERIVRKLADWWCRVSDGIADEDFERMLGCEFGGMNESFAVLYRLTGVDRYRREALRFTDRALFEPLSHGEDQLTGLHANTQIPKVIGYERVAEVTNDKAYDKAVDTFWTSVTERRSVSIGAHSVAEHFNSRQDFTSMMLSRQGVETCNSYNMAKLAGRLYLRTADGRYLDFYERVLANHLVSTVSAEEDGFVYFTPMRPRHYRAYSSSQESFWCCVGTGLESHARYGRLIYAHDGDGELSVNLFIPSSLDWHEGGIHVKQWYGVDAGMNNNGVITLGAEGEGVRTLELRMRRPWWVSDVSYSFEGCAYEPAVDSKTVPGFDVVTLEWSGSCTVRIRHTARVSMETLPDGSAWSSVLRGCKVMALRGDEGDLQGLKADDSRTSHIASGPVRRLGDLPILEGDLKAIVVPHDRSDGSVDVRCGEHVLRLVPFSSIAASRYTVYFPHAAVGGTQRLRNHLKEVDEHEGSIEERTCDSVHCGEQQSELDHRYAGEGDEQGRSHDLRYRSASDRGWFSYMIADWERVGELLHVTVVADDIDRQYGLDVDGVAIPRQARERQGDRIVDIYRLGRGSVAEGDEAAARVSIRATEGVTPRVLGITLLRG